MRTLKISRVASMYWIHVYESCAQCETEELLYEENTISELDLAEYVKEAMVILKNN